MKPNNLSPEEMAVAESLALAFSVLPEGDKKYLLGYADGVAAMAAAHREREKLPKQ